MTKLEITLLIIASIIASLFIIYIIVINVTLSIILSSPNKNEEITEENLFKSVDGKYQVKFNKCWVDKTPFKEVTTTSFDNIELHAKLFTPHPSSHVYAIFAHGYRGKWMEQTYLDEKLDKRYHMNFLLIEQRGHQKSKAKFCTMGIKESTDLLSWINYIINIDKDAQILLMGHSMGGFTVALALGKDLPSNVKCAYIEASYYSPYTQYQFVLKKYGMIIFKSGWILPSVNLFAKSRMHIDLKTSLDSSLSKTNIPTILIHGDNDSVVSFSNLKKIDDCFNKSTYHTTFVGKGADHVLSIYTDEKEYLNCLYNFLDKYFKNFN